jgi:hypothetical protein
MRLCEGAHPNLMLWLGLAFDGVEREACLQTLEDVVRRVQPYLFFAWPSELANEIFPPLSERLGGLFDAPLVDFNLTDQSGPHNRKILRINSLQIFGEHCFINYKDPVA